MFQDNSSDSEDDLLNININLKNEEDDKEQYINTIKKRFQISNENKKKKIYTFIGHSIILAINPYEEIDYYYSDEIIKKIKKYFDEKKINPFLLKSPKAHIYYLVEDAYRDMIENKKNQNFIITGESGSGKTESTRYIIKYLTDSSKENIDLIEKANYILEAFGNAKTVKNNNSSRFGKFIQINFSEKGKILYSHFSGYLLEKSRVVKIQEGERNFHIFYQFIFGADEEERKKYFIKDSGYFKYLNNKENDKNEKDAINFTKTKEYLKDLDFSEKEITYILRIIFGILYLGNIEFNDKKEHNVGTVIDNSSKSLDGLEKSSRLLGLEKKKP